MTLFGFGKKKEKESAIRQQTSDCNSNQIIDREIYEKYIDFKWSGMFGCR